MIREIIIPIAKAVMCVLFRPKVHGKENIPKEGGYILAANHLSFWDPVFMGAFLPERKILFMAKAELFRFKPFGAIIRACGAVPVNRGSRDASAILTAVDLLKSGGVLGIYPEGTRVRKGKKSNPKKGTVRMAEMAGVPIVPIHLDTKYKWFKKAHMIIGEPIYVGGEEKLSENELLDETKSLMDTIYSLKVK